MAMAKSCNDSDNLIEDLYQKIQSLTIAMEKSKGKIGDSEHAVLLQQREKLLVRLNEAKKKLEQVKLKLLQLTEEDGIPSSPTASALNLFVNATSNPNQSTSPTEDKMDQ